MRWEDFFGFERMVTPFIIRIVYIIGNVIIVLMGLFSMCSGLFQAMANQEFLAAFVYLIGGPIGILLGLLLLRVYTELLILAFRIYETLNSIEDLLRNQGQMGIR